MDIMTIVLISLITAQLIATLVITIVFSIKIKTLISQNSIIMNLINPLTKELHDIGYGIGRVDNVMNQLTAGLSTKQNVPKSLPTPESLKQLKIKLQQKLH